MTILNFSYQPSATVTMHPLVAPYFRGHDDLYPTHLATKFARVFDRMMTLWGNTEFDSYINSLIIDERGNGEVLKLLEIGVGCILRFERLAAFESSNQKGASRWQEYRGQREHATS